MTKCANAAHDSGVLSAIETTGLPGKAAVSERFKLLRKQAILLFCMLMFCYTFVHQELGWNQNSRLDLLRGLLIHKTFRIDADHVNTGDKSIHEGNYYSDKAPGIALLALPAFAVSLGAIRALNIPIDSQRAWLIASWGTTAGSVGLITSLGGVALFLFLCRLVTQQHALLTTFVIFLGSSPFPYATMLFSHAAVMALICIALWAISDDVNSPKRQPDHQRLAVRSMRHTKGSILAGLCCGLAIASEYTAALAAGGVLLLQFSCNFRRTVIMAAAALVPVSLIPAYNWICFGGPFFFGYHHLALPEFQEMNKGLFGITFPPKLAAAYLILFSPQRGLFFWTPFFFIVFAALKGALRIPSRLFWVSVCVALLQTIAISGYYMPSGGSALGPRHLAPMLPFLAILTAFGLQGFPRLGCIVGYFSLLLTGFGTVINAMPGDTILNPLLEFYIPKLQRGEFANNLAQYVAVKNWVGGTLLVMFIIAVYALWVARGVGDDKKRREAILTA